jgi:hypothetical protein
MTQPHRNSLGPLGLTEGGGSASDKGNGRRHTDVRGGFPLARNSGPAELSPRRRSLSSEDLHSTASLLRHGPPQFLTEEGSKRSPSLHSLASLSSATSAEPLPTAPGGEVTAQAADAAPASRSATSVWRRRKKDRPVAEAQEHLSAATKRSSSPRRFHLPRRRAQSGSTLPTDDDAPCTDASDAPRLRRNATSRPVEERPARPLSMPPTSANAAGINVAGAAHNPANAKVSPANSGASDTSSGRYLNNALQHQIQKFMFKRKGAGEPAAEKKGDTPPARPAPASTTTPLASRQQSTTGEQSDDEASDAEVRAREAAHARGVEKSPRLRKNKKTLHGTKAQHHFIHNDPNENIETDDEQEQSDADTHESREPLDEDGEADGNQDLGEDEEKKLLALLDQLDYESMQVTCVLVPDADGKLGLGRGGGGWFYLPIVRPLSAKSCPICA